MTAREAVKLGLRLRAALSAINDGQFVGVGSCPTFSSSGKRINWRMVADLVDRGLVSVTLLKNSKQGSIWFASATSTGRAALREGEG